MRIKPFALIALLILGCAREDESVSPPKGDISAVDRVDQMSDWLLNGYSSIEKSFAKAESDLRQTNRSAGEVLSELGESVSLLATESKVKQAELAIIKKELSNLRDGLEQLASFAPPSERTVIQGKLFDIENAIDQKIKQMQDFDFPYFSKFDSALKESLLLWERSFSVFGKTRADTARGKIAGLVSAHFRGNIAMVISHRKASRGDAQSQFDFGEMCDKGEGVPENDEQAVQWYSRAAEQGHVKAQYSLGVMYDYGYGVPENDEQAVKWYSLAAEQGHAKAQYSLGVMYDYGNGVREHDDKEAVKWYVKAAEQGDSDAQFKLGSMYGNGKFGAKDAKEAAKWYVKAAEQGNSDAQYHLGEMYDYGYGVPKDSKEALKWYVKAAEQGNFDAQYHLGEMYENGHEVSRDAKEALRWFRMSAEQGHVQAQYNLGLRYYVGEGVNEDFKESAKWYVKAAEQGHVKAQYSLGVMYDYGYGVPKDSKEALRWFRKCAEQGNSDAQYRIGLAYDRGEGLPKDALEALKWFQMSAEQGNSDAQYCLGVMYDNGHGVSRDAFEAFKWFRMSAEQGNSDARIVIILEMIKEAQSILCKYRLKATDTGESSMQRIRYSTLVDELESDFAECSKHLRVFLDAADPENKNLSKSLHDPDGLASINEPYHSWHRYIDELQAILKGSSALDSVESIEGFFDKVKLDQDRYFEEQTGLAYDSLRKSALGLNRHVLTSSKMKPSAKSLNRHSDLIDSFALNLRKWELLLANNKRFYSDIKHFVELIAEVKLVKGNIAERRAELLLWLKRVGENDMTKISEFEFDIGTEFQKVKDSVRAYAWYNCAHVNGQWEAGDRRDQIKLTKSQLAEAQALSLEIEKWIYANRRH